MFAGLAMVHDETLVVTARRDVDIFEEFRMRELLDLYNAIPAK